MGDLIGIIFLAAVFFITVHFYKRATGQSFTPDNTFDEGCDSNWKELKRIGEMRAWLLLHIDRVLDKNVPLEALIEQFSTLRETRDLKDMEETAARLELMRRLLHPESLTPHLVLTTTKKVTQFKAYKVPLELRPPYAEKNEDFEILRREDNASGFEKAPAINVQTATPEPLAG